MKYSFEQLNVGDEIFFENEYLDNFDLYWKIISKNINDTITVEVNEMGRHDRITIELKDIKYHIPSGKA